MADIALKTDIPGTGSIFDQGLQVPADPIARGKLGVAALNGVEPDFEAAVKRATQKNTISDVYGLVVAQGIDALIEQLARSGVPRETARAGLSRIEELVSKAASYPVMPAGAEQFFVTESGDILKSATEEPLAKTSEKIDRLHQFALALVSLPHDPIESLPEKTRERVLTALTSLKNEVLTPRTEGQHEVKSSTPNLRIPDQGGWVSDTIDIAASGRLEKFSLDIDLKHPYIGAVTVELVAPDRTSIKLHDQTGEGTANIKRTFTLDDAGLRALEGKEVNGRWRLRIIDHDGYNDNGTLQGWKLDVSTRGSTGSSEAYGEAKKKALYAGAGALGRRLASSGPDAFKSRAFDFTADLVKTSPYGDVRTIMIAGLNGSRDKLAAADKARLDKELVPLVAPETPDYDTIFQLKYGADGRYTAEKRSLNFVVMFGSEEDDLIYNGGLRMIERQGFTRVPESDKPGYEMFVKKVNQNDPNAPCQELKTYVARMNGSNMMQAFGDKDIDVVVYDGHSNLGRNIEASLKNAPELAGSKIFVGGACATTDRAFMIRSQFPDTKRLQLINTYESTYFNWEVENGRKYLNYSENLMLTFGLQESMSKLKAWKGAGSIADDLKRATDSWSHTKDINYTNPGMLEQLMLWDLDKNGLPDGGQQVWDGLREKVTEIVDREFTPQRPPVALGRLDAQKIFGAVHSLDTFGRYNPIAKAAYQVRTIAPRGYQDLGENGPMVRVQRNPVSRGWEVIANSWYSHASVEAFRFEMHHAFMDAAIKESNSPQVRRMSNADKNIMKLLFAGSSLVYDNSWRDDPIWTAGLKRHNYPDGVDFHAISGVLHWEHDQPADELSGNWRDIPKVKEAIGADLTRKLDSAEVGVA